MALITTAKSLDTEVVAQRVKAWLDGKGFQTKLFETGDGYAIKARKASAFRAVVGADRALEIGIRHWGGETQVEVRQGSWTTNAISNSVWLIATSGANLLISGWSVLIQRDLESFVRTTMADLPVRKVIVVEEAPTRRLRSRQPHLHPLKRPKYLKFTIFPARKWRGNKGRSNDGRRSHGWHCRGSCLCG